MEKKITTNTLRILLLTLLIAGVMGYGLYARKHTAETETAEAVVAETMETMETPEIKVETPETETTETVEAETAASPSGDAAAVCLDRYYQYRNEEYFMQNFLEYREIIGLGDIELQDKINHLIQKLALDERIGQEVAYMRYLGKFDAENWDPYIIECDLSYYDLHIYGDLFYMRKAEHDYHSNATEHFRVCNLTTGKELTLDDILMWRGNSTFWKIMDDKFYDPLTEEEKNQLHTPSVRETYEEWREKCKDSEYLDSAFASNELWDYSWFIDDNGELTIYDFTESPIYFSIDLSEFKDIIKPEYAWLLDDNIQGMHIPYAETIEVFPEENFKEDYADQVSIQTAYYEYGDELQIEYPEIKEMENDYLRIALNDKILQKVLNESIDNLYVGYKDNLYYWEEQYQYLWPENGILCTTSKLLSYQLNGRIFSFTMETEMKQKAYTDKEGIRHAEEKTEPYGRAYNLDCTTGEYLLFEDVFTLDSTLKDVIQEKAGNIANSIDENMVWFIDKDQNLNICRSDDVNDSSSYVQIPLSSIKDAIKPEYQSCFQLENVDVTEEE